MYYLGLLRIPYYSDTDQAVKPDKLMMLGQSGPEQRRGMDRIVV
jgi:hypothetical protein